MSEHDELKQNYDLLDVPYSTSVHLIRQRYRRIVKRWHPDRYQSGTPAHAEATQMMKRINQAYSQIENAPLSRTELTITTREDTPSQMSASPSTSGWTWRQLLDYSVEPSLRPYPIILAQRGWGF